MGAVAVSAIVLAAFYVIEAFTAPDPRLRIVLRCLPVLPVAVWILWFDPSRPFERRRPLVRQAARLALLVLAIAFAVTVLGIGLNWIYDPNRVI